MYLLLVLLLTVAMGQVPQLDPNNLPERLRNSEWLMVYFYSPTCNYCKEFSPQFAKLAHQLKDSVEFGKLDAAMYTDVSAKYRITHFPTLMLFHGGIDLPISYNGERKLEDLRDWIKAQMKFSLPILAKANNNTIVYHGDEGTYGYKLTKVLALRDKYKYFARQPLQEGEQSHVSLGKW